MYIHLFYSIIVVDLKKQQRKYNFKMGRGLLEELMGMTHLHGTVYSRLIIGRQLTSNYYRPTDGEEF